MIQPNPIKIVVEKADDIEGFGAYAVGANVILLNVYATLAASVAHDIPAKELILETLMHEFGHAMQEWLDIEFSEETVERFIRSYQEKYGVQ